MVVPRAWQRQPLARSVLATRPEALSAEHLDEFVRIADGHGRRGVPQPWHRQYATDRFSEPEAHALRGRCRERDASICQRQVRRTRHLPPLIRAGQVGRHDVAGHRLQHCAPLPLRSRSGCPALSPSMWLRLCALRAAHQQRIRAWCTADLFRGSACDYAKPLFEIFKPHRCELFALGWLCHWPRPFVTGLALRGSVRRRSSENPHPATC